MQITCINARKQQLKFGWFRPFWLEKAEGLGADFEVSIYAVHNMDGSLYSGAWAKSRNIVLTLKILRRDGFADCRDRLYSFFQPRSAGMILVKDGGIQRQAVYYTESVSVEGSGPSRTATISLICPDPLFYDMEDTYTNMASFDDLIEFPWSFEAPFAVSEKAQSLIRSIYNDSAVTVGLKIRFRAAGSVTNPQMTDVNRGTKLTVNTAMQTGDELLIDTGARTIVRSRGNIDTNLINALSWDSTWLQLEPGDNLFRFGADGGIDLLSAAIVTRKGYWGA